MRHDVNRINAALPWLVLLLNIELSAQMWHGLEADFSYKTQTTIRLTRAKSATPISVIIAGDAMKDRLARLPRNR
jgi:hypothetical protein